jgi:hypothetical protein
VVLLVFLAWAPAAYAWSWPVQGPVLKPFVYDEAHPYASDQHRGVDIGADSAGETVAAPAAGTVSFAGTVPTNGRSVTIETADGYSVTLTHLGSVGVVKGATVAEEDAIGTVGPTGTPEVEGPYVHLGIRLTADPNGYVDPLGLLPPASGSGAEDTGSTTSQPASSVASSAPSAGKPTSSAPPASKPASSAPRSPRVAHARGSTAKPRHARAIRTDAQPRRSSERPTARDTRTPLEHATPHSRLSARTSSSRRPVVEPAAPKPIGLDTGHTIQPTPLAAQFRREPSKPTLGLVCNGAAALFAVGTALVTGRRRRRLQPSPALSAEVLHLARSTVEPGRVSRAA